MRSLQETLLYSLNNSDKNYAFLEDNLDGDDVEGADLNIGNHRQRRRTASGLPVTP